MSSTYFYVVDRDFGFAPNPFHGYCSLATCKPGIRNSAIEQDWIIGMGGNRLKATGRCIFAMQVSNKITFNEYWTNPLFANKKPMRNGSRKTIVGDNIYCYNDSRNSWSQADSHHSHADGSLNTHNLKTDTKSHSVLLSNHFWYFGSTAPNIPEAILKNIGYKNCRNYRKFESSQCVEIISWLEKKYGRSHNLVLGDPFDFHSSHKRYSAGTNKIT